MFLCFFGSKTNHFLYIFFSFVSSAYLKLVFSLQKQLLYFTHHKLEQILQVQNQLLSTCNIFQLSKIMFIHVNWVIKAQLIHAHPSVGLATLTSLIAPTPKLEYIFGDWSNMKSEIFKEIAIPLLFLFTLFAGLLPIKIGGSQRKTGTKLMSGRYGLSVSSVKRGW